MLELFLCSMLTILPDFLYRRFVQGKRLGREINLFTVWVELRWGITLCLLLTLSLITTVFYFHPSTKAASSVFRTVTILPETSGRVSETFVEINQRVKEGQPLFRLDGTQQEAAAETARRKIAEIEAAMVVAKSQLAEAEGRVVQARGALKLASDELARRSEVLTRSPGSIAEAEVERVRVQVDSQQGALDAALASREAIVSSRSRRPWWSRAPTGCCSSSPCALAMWSTPCSDPPASWCRIARRPTCWPDSARSRRR